jgi:hypothetical protein
MLFGVGSCRAGGWSVSASTDKEVSTEATVDGSTTDVSKSHSFSLDFDTNFTPSLEFSTSFTFDVGEETPDSDFASSTYDTSVAADVTAQWWSISSSWDQGVSKSEDPEVSTETTWSYSFETKIEPEYEDLPTFSYAFDGDKDSIDRAYSGAFEYTFLEKIDISVDASRDLGDPRPGEDSDSDSRSLSAAVAYGEEFSDTITFDTDWSMDRSQELTLTSRGLLLEKTDTLDNTVQASIGFNPLDWIDSSISRDISWSKDLMLPDQPTERDETMSTEISMSPSLTDTLEFSISHTDDRTKTSGSEAESRTWGQSISSTLDFTPLESFQFNASYDRTYDRTIPSAPGEVVEKARDDAYDFGLEISLFDDQISYTVTRSFGYAWTQGVQTADDSTWDHALDLSWDHIPNLTFSPSYAQTRESNYFEGTQSTTRSITAEATYAVELGGVTSIELNHSYSRDAEYPDGAVNYLSRSDSTSFTLGFDGFLRGMSTEFSLDRDASDESGDDVGPVVDFTHAFTYDWEILDNYSFNFSYDHDMPQDGDDSENYSSAFSFSAYDSKIDFSFSYDYSVQLEGDKNESSSYVIELSGEL